MKNKIGIVGGGQLGRMLSFEAKKMGFHVTVIDPTPQSPAAQVVDEHILGGYSDAVGTEKIASQSDFITIELEHINTDTLQKIADKGISVNPAPKTVEIIKNKFQQKEFLRKHRIATADFKEVTTAEDIEEAGKLYGFPLLLKAKKDAFDGRGNFFLKNKKQIPEALKKLAGRELYVEKFVPFERELAIIVARGKNGKVVHYPVVETIHKNNICHLVIAPAPVDKKIIKKAEKLAYSVMQQLKGTGVFGIEMFLTKDHKILINEIAPRVHNSGHFTIEACVTNQFEQHIRAITGLPLGSTRMVTPAAVMINILGERSGLVEISGRDKVLGLPETFIHIYGKKDSKDERKMGHITVLGDDVKKLISRAKRARKYITM